MHWLELSCYGYWTYFCHQIFRQDLELPNNTALLLFGAAKNKLLLLETRPSPYTTAADTESYECDLLL